MDFLLKFFNVATTNDDPDQWRTRQKEAENHEDALVARKIIEQVHRKVNELVEANEDIKPEITKLIKKYTKKESGKASANYFSIKSPDIAGELLEKVNSFMEESGKAAKKGA